MRPDSSSPNIYDRRIQRQVQGRHSLGGCPHHPPGALRYVLRLRHLGHMRTREERHPAGPRQFLPHAFAQWCHLAHRGHANGAKVSHFYFILLGMVFYKVTVLLSMRRKGRHWRYNI